MIDALGRKIKYVYDVAHRLIETIQADDTPGDDTDNPRITTSYDALSRKTSQTDQSGRTTQYEYNAVGNLIAVIDPIGQRTEYGYERGNKNSQIDAGGRTTTWAYDNLGRQTSRTLPEGQTKTFTYDTNGNKLSHTNFNGNTTTYAYEADTHRLSTVTDSDGTTRYTYSPTGRIETVTDQNGTVSYQYDTQDRLIQQIQADGTVLAYTYDTNGNTTTVSVTRGGQTFVTQHTYDELNRLVSTTDHNGNLTAYYTYDAVGNRETVNYPNGTWSYYRYNERNQLTELRHTDALDNLVERYSYSLDPTGRRSRITENSGRVTDYVYDDLYRLTGETVTDPVNGNYSASYQYDATGNRTGETVNGIHTAYTYDNNDRLLQQGGIVYTYDDNGNTLSETLNGNTVTYSYDAGNRLTQVTQGGVTTAYTYNHNGIRISKTEGGITTDYIVDENRDYAQVLIETTPAGQVVYTYGDDLVSQDRDGVLSLYHYDGLGSTRFLSDAGGAVTDWYDYVAFGEVLNQTGGTENLYLFAGEQFDTSLEQYYLRARYYDQEVGRFTQMDVWIGSSHDPVTLHKYLYANANPVLYSDPSGKFALLHMNLKVGLMMTAQRAVYWGSPIFYLTNRYVQLLPVFANISTNVKSGISGVYRFVGYSTRHMNLYAGQVFEKILKPVMEGMLRARSQVRLFGGRARPDWIFGNGHIIDAKLGQYISWKQFQYFVRFVRKNGGSINYIALTKPPAKMVSMMRSYAQLNGVVVRFFHFLP